MKPFDLQKLEHKSAIRHPREMRGLVSETAFTHLLAGERNLISRATVADEVNLHTTKDNEKGEPADTSPVGELEQFWISKKSGNTNVEKELFTCSTMKDGETSQIMSSNLAQFEAPNAQLIVATTNCWEPLQTRTALKAVSVLQQSQKTTEVYAGAELQLMHPGISIAPPSEFQNNSNALTVVTEGLKSGTEGKQISAQQKSLPKDENPVVPTDCSIVQKSGPPEVMLFANLPGDDLSKSFTQLIASEHPPQDANKPAEVSLHFKQEKDGPVIKHLKLQLQPENLGKLNVTIHRQDDGLRIVVQAQTAAAHAKFTAEQDEIFRSLDLIGVKISEISIQPLSGALKEPDAVDRGQSLQSALGQGQSSQGRSGSEPNRNAKPASSEDLPKFESKSGVYI